MAEDEELPFQGLNSGIPATTKKARPSDKIPSYRMARADNIRIHDLKDARTRQILADRRERTKDTDVPQFRDGECEVRRLWDEGVAEAMGWDATELACLRHMLHQEPHVRSIGYGQYGDEAHIEPADRERFQELANQWENEREGPRPDPS